MALPVLLDLNVVADGAAAVCLALASEQLDVRAVVAGGGAIPADQSVKNASRILASLNPESIPALARGCDIERKPPKMKNRSDDGPDGLNGADIPAAPSRAIESCQDVYREFLRGDGPRSIVTAGPLTTLAAMIGEMPDAWSRVTGICICGGAVWTQGDAAEHVEYNFGLDAAAAARVLTSGLPITVAPLDVTNYICLDASNLAHLAASGYRTGQLAAKLLEPRLERETPAGAGRTYVAPLVAVASLIWPDLFIRTRMRLDVATGGAQVGRSTPGLGGDKSKQINLLTAVNAVDLVENMLEALCHEAFIV